MTPPDTTGPRAKVLVVDDDKAFGALVSEVLTDKGYDAQWVSSPEEALARSKEQSFEVAVVDLVMPQMGGLELVERLKKTNPDTEPIILTGQGDLDSAIEGIRHGVFDYFQKSAIQIGRLERRVREAVEKSRLTRENREVLSRLEFSNRLLKSLHVASSNLAGEQHLDRLLDGLASAARETCQAAAARVVLLDRGPQGGDLVIEAVGGDSGEVTPGIRLRQGEGIVGLAAGSEAALLVPDPAAHPAYSSRCDELKGASPGLLAAPVRHRDVYGAVLVGGSLRGGFGEAERDALSALARQAAVAIDNARQHERSLNYFIHTSEILVSFLESMDVQLPGHSQNTAALSDMLTRRLGLGESERRSIHFGALLHDIGKVRIPIDVIRRKGALSDEDRLRIQEHPRLGLEMLSPITAWEDVLAMIHAHHERWDGKGYPRGLAGEEIPLGARVVAVAEVFDAMARPHTRGRRVDPLAEIEAGAGTQFDPRIARLFLAEYRERGDPRPTS